jgi:hypothetical protein
MHFIVTLPSGIDNIFVLSIYVEVGDIFLQCLQRSVQKILKNLGTHEICMTMSV